MKKITSILILSMLFAALLVPVTAQAADKPQIIDDPGMITENGLNELNGYAREISDAYQLDVAYYLVENTTGQTLTQYINDRYLNVEKLSPDGFALVHDLENKEWDVVSFGKAESLITEDAEYRFWDAYGASDTYYDGVLAYLKEASSFLAGAAARRAVNPEDVRNGYVFDEVGVLTETQIAILNEKAAELTEKREFDAYIWIVDLVPNEYAEYSNGDLNLDGLEAYVDEFYEVNGLGYGENKDGMVLLLETGDVPGRRDYMFTTYGSCTSAFDNANRDSLLDSYVVPRFREAFDNGNFFAVADTFLVRVEAEYVFNFWFWLVMKLFVIILLPILIAFIVCRVWKKQMKTAKIATTAGNYIPAGGFQLTGKSDVFMYRTTTREYIERESSSSGGGGSSSSSSGRSSGGRV